MYWKKTDFDSYVFPACEQVVLPEGILVSDIGFVSADKIAYQQICQGNSIPMLITNIGVLNKYAERLPIVAESWHQYTEDSMGIFAYSVVSVIYSISISAVITWFLTIFVVTNYTIKSPLLLKASTIISSIYFLVVIIRSFVILDSQQNRGFLDSTLLVQHLNSSLDLNILDLISVILLLFNQVHILMRLFQRQSDKRLTLLIGGFATIATQVIWSISNFHDFYYNEEANEILAAFVYLLRIAMSVCYAALISVHLISKTRYIIANKSIWLVSLLTLILVYSPVAFFFADVSNVWVYDLSEIFSVVAYVICVVIPWEWYNKFNVIMEAEEKEGILGRRFFEDEVYEFDSYEVFGNDIESDHYDNQNADVRSNFSNNTNSGDHSKNFLNTSTAKNILYKARQIVLNITDEIIAAGFAIPRPVSSSSPNNATNNNIALENLSNEATPRVGRDRTFMMRNNGRSSMGVNNSNSRNRDMFIYSTKQVVIELHDEET